MSCAIPGRLHFTEEMKGEACACVTLMYVCPKSFCSLRWQHLCNVQGCAQLEGSVWPDEWDARADGNPDLPEFSGASEGKFAKNIPQCGPIGSKRQSFVGFPIMHLVSLMLVGKYVCQVLRNRHCMWSNAYVQYSEKKEDRNGMVYLWLHVVFCFQLSLLLSGVTSFESFCRLDPNDVFLRAPNSTWDYSSWMQRLCSVQVDQLLKELNQTVLVDQFSNIVSVVSLFYICARFSNWINLMLNQDLIEQLNSTNLFSMFLMCHQLCWKLEMGEGKGTLL